MADEGRRRRPHGGGRSLRHRFANGRFSGGGSPHPEDLVAVVVVDGTSFDGARAGPVCCFGALHVRIVAGDPVFATRHVATAKLEDRADVLNRLAGLCSGRDVVLGCSHPYDSFDDRRHLLASGTVLLDAVARFEGMPPSDLLLYGRSEHSMVRIADGFDLSCCRRTEPFDQARCAAARAQLVWLAYVRSRLAGRSAAGLLAAYRAWALIEKCRPVPF